MFNDLTQPLWTQERFHRKISFVRGEELMKEMQELTDLGGAPALKINVEYATYKKIGGVRIETGLLSLCPGTLKECLSLLDDFLPLGKGAVLEPRQNFDALSTWAGHFNWPAPGLSKCGGYILNRELVRFEEDLKGSCLLFKFKDEITDTFMLYRIWFLVARSSYFFLIQKTY